MEIDNNEDTLNTENSFQADTTPAPTNSDNQVNTTESQSFDSSGTTEQTENQNFDSGGTTEQTENQSFDNSGTTEQTGNQNFDSRSTTEQTGSQNFDNRRNTEQTGSQNFDNRRNSDQTEYRQPRFAPRSYDNRDNNRFSRDGGNRGGAFRRQGKKEKFDRIKSEKLIIDYKRPEILKRFLTEKGKILSRYITGNSAKNQRKLTQEVKRARYIGLLPSA